MKQNFDHKAWNAMSEQQQADSIDVTRHGWEFPPTPISVSLMARVYERDDEFQAALPASDARHHKMFEFARDGQWVCLYWPGYCYEYDLGRINRPEDLLWLLHHLLGKRWKHATLKRAQLLIEAIAGVKGWEVHSPVPHPNEAPRPNIDKVAERQKMTPALRYSVIRRDQYRCRCCGFAVQDGAHLHVDHIIPVSKGGLTKISNLQTLCTVCNLGKAAK